jgi:hypothetical protein
VVRRLDQLQQIATITRASKPRRHNLSGSLLVGLPPAGASAPGSADRRVVLGADRCGSTVPGSGAPRQVAGRCGQWGPHCMNRIGAKEAAAMWWHSPTITCP